MIEVILNGNKVQTEPGITILELARRNGLEIPTLCHDEELKPYGSCWVCAVEVKGRRGFVTSCGTNVTPGMEITTDGEDIRAARKMALELLISNHYADCEAPCKIACPDHVDIQGYVSLIANGQYHEAVKVIKDTLPMPLSIGRVCPAFCEKECRRQIVEDPIAIRQLKRFAADEDLNDAWNYVPDKEASTGKKVAIVGAGPSGLTCGFYLSNLGHEVVIFESAPAAGGWLRFGIPEYRLPKAILDREIELMCASGMKIEYNKSLGKDIQLKNLCAQYDAVYLAIGAQKAVPMPVKGSDQQGCYLGVDFLKAHSLGNTPPLGKKVAIVGGGNTAIDCARTAIRLGCEVSVIYRRTKDEMPAEPFEIEAAGHEGVIFHYLCNPVEYFGENGKLKEVKIERMRLGEPDSSGRRRPEPTGEFFTKAYDSIIAAISQVPEVDVFTAEDNHIQGQILPVSRWQTAVVDEGTMYTGLGNVFAGGDFRRGAATAIEAIADGRFASEAINRYLNGVSLVSDSFRFDSKKGYKVQEISPEEYAGFEKAARELMPEIPVAEAKASFKEVEQGFAESVAKAEADRCLECGCQVNETCKLRDFCSEYHVEALRFPGSINKHPIDYSHPFIVRDTNKCINCGRCVRTCAEIQGPAVLGYIYRGFAAVVAPEFGESLTQTTCESCGKCIAVCPVGALVERNLNYKLNPLPKDTASQSCGMCGTGCKITCETQSGVPVRVTTDEEHPGFNGRNLCFKGRFGWQALYAEDRLRSPLKKENGGWLEISWKDVLALISDRLKASPVKRFEVSPHISLEEMLMVQRAAQSCDEELCADQRYKVFSSEFLTLQPTLEPYQILDNFEQYVIVGKLSHTLQTMLRLKQRQGKRLISVICDGSDPLRFADTVHSSLASLDTSKRQLYIYNINQISEQNIGRVLNAAFIRDPQFRNVLETTDYQNHYGLQLLRPSFELAADADFILAYGTPARKSKPSSFCVEIMQFASENSEADLILPATSYLEIDGTALASDFGITRFHNPSKSILANELLRLFYELDWISPATADINHWNEAAQDLLESATSIPEVAYDPGLIDLSLLRDTVIPVDSLLQHRVTDLYEQRKLTSKF
ncbi:MAG: FAD-dependent oxidoreductase [Candidatus Syntrophosphaera sp.]|nr:FAD-dependent oxidoreductase [Candidatus Syntrophosphaera sp.]